MTETDLKNVATLSGVLGVEDDFLTSEFRDRCQAILPNPEDIVPNTYVEAFLQIKYSIINEVTE